MTAKTPNLSLDVDYIGAGPGVQDTHKKNMQKIDTALVKLPLIANATNSTDVVTQFNALLAALKAANRMATS